MGNVQFKTPGQVADERLEGWRNSAKVSPFQLRVALARKGLLGQVRQMMSGRDKDSDAALAWEYATEIRRNSQLAVALGFELGLTEEEMDDLITLGQSIEV